MNLREQNFRRTWGKMCQFRRGGALRAWRGGDSTALEIDEGLGRQPLGLKS